MRGESEIVDTFNNNKNIGKSRCLENGFAQPYRTVVQVEFDQSLESIKFTYNYSPILLSCHYALECSSKANAISTQVR